MPNEVEQKLQLKISTDDFLKVFEKYSCTKKQSSKKHQSASLIQNALRKLASRQNQSGIVEANIKIRNANTGIHHYSENA